MAKSFQYLLNITSRFYFSKFIIIKLFLGIADIYLDYIEYSELNEETNLYEMNVVPVIKILANKNNFCNVNKCQR